MTEGTDSGRRQTGGRRSGRAKFPLIGAQISTAGGFAPVPERAAAIGAEVVQIFSSNPRIWKARVADPEERAFFVAGLQRRRLPLFFHTIYLINLASPDEELRSRSATALAHSLLTGALTGATAVVTHVGSHRGDGFRKATVRVTSAVLAAAQATRHSLAAEGHDSPLPRLLLEGGAGSGDMVGTSLEELGALLAALESTLEPPPLGICLDTAHMFAAGYPVHEADGLDRLIDELSRRDLLHRVGLIHLNDSATSFGSHRDWHENPGRGMIGYTGLARVVRHPALSHIPFVLEVPGADGHGPDAASIAVVKAMRAGAEAPPEGPARVAERSTEPGSRDPGGPPPPDGRPPAPPA